MVIISTSYLKSLDHRSFAKRRLTITPLSVSILNKSMSYSQRYKIMIISFDYTYHWRLVNAANIFFPLFSHHELDSVQEEHQTNNYPVVSAPL